MGTQTLFGDADEIARPRTPPPEQVVRELIALGVEERVARSYEARRAFKVRDRLRAERAERDQAGGGDEVATAPPPAIRADRGGSLPERHTLANDLEQMLAREMGDPWERLCNRLVYSLYPLTRPEFVRVVRAVIRELRGEA